METVRITPPAAAAAALDILERCGHEAYLVGGCVRDSLLGLTPGDWDICTSARPEETKAAFSAFRVVETGIQHGTVTVLVDGLPLEITTFRRDGTYADGRHPDRVTFTSRLEEDLARRDFTCNAMAWSRQGGLADPFGGRADLEKGLLRCVGEPERRFQEDALRLLRALRFAARYGFSIEPETGRALWENRDGLRRISAERIFSEFCGILCGAHAGEMLRQWAEVFFVFLPEAAPLKGFDQHLPSHRYDAWEHTIHAVDAAPREKILRLAAFFHDIGKPDVFYMEDGRGHFPLHGERSGEIANAVLTRLRCDNATRRAVVTLVSHHDNKSYTTDALIRRELAALGVERTRQLYALRRADAAAHATPRGDKRLADVEAAERRMEELLAEGGCLSLRELAVNGDDLLALGFRGRELGETLDALLQQVLAGETDNERAALLRRAAERKKKETGL